MPQTKSKFKSFQARPYPITEDEGYDLEWDATREWINVEPIVCHVTGERLVWVIAINEHINRPTPNQQTQDVCLGDPKEIRSLAAHLLKLAQWVEKKPSSAKKKK